GQRLVVALDGVGRVAGAVSVLGHDDRDRVAEIANRVDGDRGIGRRLGVGVRHHPGAGDAAEARVLHVRPGEDAEDAGEATGPGGVYLLYAGVRIGRAPPHHV